MKGTPLTVKVNRGRNKIESYDGVIENTYPNDRMSEKAPESSAQDLTSRFCPYCGEKGSASDVFCGSCGKNISQQDTSLTR
jgi:hypothetical protein